MKILIKFWDTHIHLFPPPLFRAIWRWFDDYGWKIPFAHWEIDAYVDYLKKMGMERGFLLTYAHKADMSLALNQWVKETCQLYPCFIPFACVHPDDTNLEQEIVTVMDDWEFAGFKLQLAVSKFPASHPGLAPVYQAAAERQKPVIIHTGTAPYPPGLSYLGLKHLEKVLEQWPTLKVVVPHFGLYELDQALSLLEKYPHVYLDTSWALGRPEFDADIDKLAAAMEGHPQKFLYGSDFPILETHPQDAIDSLLQYGLTKTTLENILTKNARRLVGLG